MNALCREQEERIMKTILTKLSDRVVMLFTPHFPQSDAHRKEEVNEKATLQHNVRHTIIFALHAITFALMALAL